ncbi:MAG: C40 family peptidase [Flavobacterium sp.]
MKNNIFVYIMFLFVTILHAQNNPNGFEINDMYDGEMEELLNKNYKDSLQKEQKAKKLSVSEFFKKNKKELKKIEFENFVEGVDLFLARNKIIDSAKIYLGTPYKYGGMSRNGIDCSALIFRAFQKNNRELPRTSFAQSKLGKKIKKRKAEIGDLIFFKTSRRNVVSHVGIIVENKNGSIKFIHASSSRGVTISSLDNETYFKRKFAKIKRIIG